MALSFQPSAVRGNVRRRSSWCNVLVTFAHIIQKITAIQLTPKIPKRKEPVWVPLEINPVKGADGVHYLTRHGVRGNAS
jgi:hypothetical protein